MISMSDMKQCPVTRSARSYRNGTMIRGAPCNTVKNVFNDQGKNATGPMNSETVPLSGATGSLGFGRRHATKVIFACFNDGRIVCGYGILTSNFLSLANRSLRKRFVNISIVQIGNFARTKGKQHHFDSKCTMTFWQHTKMTLTLRLERNQLAKPR